MIIFYQMQAECKTKMKTELKEIIKTKLIIIFEATVGLGIILTGYLILGYFYFKILVHKKIISS